MNRETAIRKVLACLRMAESSNPHEAAAALRQARAMMEKYGLNDDAILAAQIHTAEAKTRCAGADPSQSLAWLIGLVADGFRCTPVVQIQHWPQRRTVVIFHGAGADARIAAYAFTVLRRQMDRDRLSHIKRVRKRANRDRRGEEFALGWVYGVSRLFPKAELPEGREKRLMASVRSQHRDTSEGRSRDLTKRGKGHWNDQNAGYKAGRSAELNQGIDGDQQRYIGGASCSSET